MEVFKGTYPVWEMLRELGGSEYEAAANVLEETWRCDENKRKQNWDALKEKEKDRKKKEEEQGKKDEEMKKAKKELLRTKEEHLKRVRMTQI